MKFIARFLYVPLAGLLVLTSCAKDETESYDKFENQALEAWMTQHRSDLVENLQSEGLYYVDLLDAGDLASDPINTEDIWVSFDFSGRDLSGNIILTRNADDAVLAGSFSKYTHYVPFYRYCGSENSGLMEGTWLAMRRTLTLGDTYFRNNKDRLGITSPEVTLRYGSKIRLYMPSSVVGNGVEGTGGYEGQEGYSLSSKRPFIVTMEIRDTVSNPLEREGTDVDDFCELNGGLQIYSKGDDDTPATEVPEDPEDPEHPYNETSKRWVSACDSIPQVYVNVRYNPAEPRDQLSFPAPYHVGYEPYVSEASVRDIDMQIAEALKNLYRTGEADEIHLVYQRFDSVLHQTPVHRQLLPAAPEADAPAANNNYLFVPDAQTVLDNVLELYLNNTVYAVMLEARVGEHAARMTAMTAATDSTAELIEDLNLEFNRARQAAITTEISEIVGGSAALKKSDKSD